MQHTAGTPLIPRKWCSLLIVKLQFWYAAKQFFTFIA